MEYRLLASSACAVCALALGILTFGDKTDDWYSMAKIGYQIGARRPGPAPM